MLHLLAEHAAAVQASHEAFDFNRVVASTLTLASEHLSAEYFDGCKDRLYCGAPDGASRRAVQTVLNASLDAILLSIGPILPFLAEEVHEHRPSPRPPPPIERVWELPPAEWTQPELARRWSLALRVKDVLHGVLHTARLDKLLKGGGEALVEVRAEAGGELLAALTALGPELNDLLGVSATRLACLDDGAGGAEAGGTEAGGAEAGGTEAGTVEAVVGRFEGELAASRLELEQHGGHRLRIVVHKTTAPKCERCWRHVPLVDALEAVESSQLDDGWLFRGHPDGACKRWLDAAPPIETE